MNSVLDAILDNKVCSVCDGAHGMYGRVRKADGVQVLIMRACPMCNPHGALSISLPVLQKSRSEGQDDADEDALRHEHEKYKDVLGEHGYATHPIETEHFDSGVVHTHNRSGGHQVVVSIGHSGISEWQHSHNHSVHGRGVGHRSLDEHLEDVHGTHASESGEREDAAEHRAADELAMRKDEGKLQRSGGIIDFIKSGKVIPIGDARKKKQQKEFDETYAKCSACKLPCNGPDDCGCDDDCPLHGVNKSFAAFTKSRHKGKAKRKVRSKAGKAKVHKTMHEFKHGTLHSGSKHGPEVTNRKQAIAIALNQARKVGKSLSIFELAEISKAGTPKYTRKSAAAMSITDFIAKAEEGPDCPACGGPGSHLGTLGTREHFRCRNCGMDFSHKDSEEYKARPADERKADRKFRSGMDKAIWQNILTKKSASRPGDPRDCPKCGGAGLYVMEMGERTFMHCDQCGDDYSFMHHRYNDPTHYIDAEMAEKHEHVDGHHVSNIEVGSAAEKSAGRKPTTFLEDLGAEYSVTSILDYITKSKHKKKKGKHKAKLGSGARFKQVEKNAKGARINGSKKMGIR